MVTEQTDVDCVRALQAPAISMSFLFKSSSDLRDKQVSKGALAIPTAFRITEDDRSLLRQAAALALQQSPELQRFVQATVSRTDLYRSCRSPRFKPLEGLARVSSGTE